MLLTPVTFIETVSEDQFSQAIFHWIYDNKKPFFSLRPSRTKLKRKWEKNGRETWYTRDFSLARSLSRGLSRAVSRALKGREKRAVRSLERYQNLIQNTYANILVYTSSRVMQRSRVVYRETFHGSLVFSIRVPTSLKACLHHVYQIQVQNY